jgi:hypothetical protein
LKTWYYLFSQTLGSCFNSVSFHTQVYASATRQRVNRAHAFIVSVILYWNWKNHHLIASINGRHLSLLLSHGNSCVHGKKRGQYERSIIPFAVTNTGMYLNSCLNLYITFNCSFFYSCLNPFEINLFLWYIAYVRGVGC